MKEQKFATCGVWIFVTMETMLRAGILSIVSVTLLYRFYAQLVTEPLRFYAKYPTDLKNETTFFDSDNIFLP